VIYGFLNLDFSENAADTYFINSFFMRGFPLSEEDTLPYYYGEREG